MYRASDAGPRDTKLQFGHDPEVVESSVAVGTSRGASLSLQFGHDPEVVESTMPVATTFEPVKLQFGHDPEVVERVTGYTETVYGKLGFNSATTRRSWKVRNRPAGVDRVARLQFGHDPEVVERRYVLQAAALATAASIRPRPGGRGKGQGRREGVRRRVPASIRPRPGGRGKARRWAVRGWGTRASIRPRPGGRGKGYIVSTGAGYTLTLQFGHDPEVVERFVYEADVFLMHKLQFGHDPEVVESGASAVPVITVDALQFGHDPEVVESRAEDRAGPRADRFNSATTRRSWKARARVRVAGRHDDASIRPRPGGRGKSIARGSELVRPDGFNSATTRRSWKVAYAALHSHRGPCFNSATTRRSWKVRRLLLVAHLAEVASIRPRPGGRGKRRTRSVAVR